MIPYWKRRLDSGISRHYGVIISFMLGYLAKRTWVWLSSEEINHSSHQLVPLLLVVSTEIVSYLDDVRVYALDTPVNIAFLGIGNWSEFMLLFDNFWEIPKFWRATHILALEGVIHRLHMLECFCSTLKFFILSLFSWQHSFSNDGIFDILMNCFIDMFELLDCNLNNFVFEIFVAVVIPDPVSP